MQTYPIDIDPQQIVRWIIAERQAAPAAFRISVRRSAEVREIPARRELHLGDEEREDLSEVAAIATLEIGPRHASDGWLLTMVAEDEAGPRLPDSGAMPGGEQQIDLGAFYQEYIRPGRGTVTVTAQVENPAAKARLTRLLNAIERNRPHAERAASRR